MRLTIESPVNDMSTNVDSVRFVVSISKSPEMVPPPNVVSENIVCKYRICA